MYKKINVQKNKEAIFSVNVYNDDWDSSIPINGDLNCGSGGPSASAIPQPIPVGDDAGFKFVLDKTQTSPDKAGTHVCILTFSDGTTPISKQIVVQIK